MATAEEQLRRDPSGAPTRVVDRLSSDVDGGFTVMAEVPRQPAKLEDRPVGTLPPTGVQLRRTPGVLALGLAIAGWPVWWLLGATKVVFPLTAVALVIALRRRGGVRVPDGFWIWILFLLLVLISGLALDVEAPGTQTASGIGRYFAFGARFANYAAVTVVMLYVGNLTEGELPRRRVIGWLASLGVVSVLLALLAMVFPTLQFTSPLGALLPGELSDGGLTKLAQVQPVLEGDPTPRPAAPFAYTNAWGNNTSLLLVWLVVAWGVLGSRRRRILAIGLLVLSLLPIVYSLNRGMWIGLGVALLIVAVRLAARGRSGLLVGAGLAMLVAAVVFAMSPLADLVQARLDAGHSNETRGSLASSALATAMDSPVIGFGSTRQTIGSDASIAIGPSADCPLCGNRDIGSTGQFTLLLIAQGIVGLALYIGFFLRILVSYRQDHSVVGIAGSVVVVMSVLYGLFYTALTMPLAITMISVALLWRNDQVRKAHGRSVLRGVTTWPQPAPPSSGAAP